MRPAERVLPIWTEAPFLAGLELARYFDRQVTPEETVGRLWPVLEDLGISRVARQTGLDRIGIPCWAAFRPNSRSLAGSQGKGLTDAAACASAIMESAEAAIAERPHGLLRTASASELDREGSRWFDPRKLMRGRFYREKRIAWLEGRDLLSGAQVLVPRAAVDVDGEATDIKGICKTTNGLASGNTTQEALFHGLCELIERDGTALASLTSLDVALVRCFSASALGDPAVDALEGAIRKAGFSLALFDQTSDLGIPVVMAMISPIGADRHIEIAAGYGCHPVAARAAIRAITEAAQGRVTSIAASRDDIERHEFEAAAHPEVLAQAAAVARAPAPRGLPPGTVLSDLLQHLLRALRRSECPVIGLDISPPGLPFAVAKVLSPVLEDRDANLSWRPGARADAILEREAA